MPGWTEDYEAMSEALVGSPFDTPAEIAARVLVADNARREWAARPWWSKAWHCQRGTKAMAFLYAAMLFLVLDGTLGTDEPLRATLAAKSYTAPYVVREHHLHGKMWQDDDVRYGPYWTMQIQYPVGGRVLDSSYRVDPATYNEWPEGPINMVWRKGRWTGIQWKSWVGKPAEAQ